jgi:hypothetical protein
MAISTTVPFSLSRSGAERRGRSGGKAATEIREREEGGDTVASTPSRAPAPDLDHAGARGVVVAESREERWWGGDGSRRKERGGGEQERGGREVNGGREKGGHRGVKGLLGFGAAGGGFRKIPRGGLRKNYIIIDFPFFA